MTVLLLAALLAVLAIRALQHPAVRTGLAAAAVLAVAVAAVTGHGTVLLALAALVAAGTLAAVRALAPLAVPAPARHWRAA